MTPAAIAIITLADIAIAAWLVSEVKDSLKSTRNKKNTKQR